MWCRDQIGIPDSLLFEVDDLVLQKNLESFVLCLLEVSRKGRKFGMRIPALVALDASVEREEKELTKLQKSLPSRISKSSTCCSWELLRDVDTHVNNEISKCLCMNKFYLDQEAPGRYFTLSGIRVFIRVKLHEIIYDNFQHLNIL